MTAKKIMYLPSSKISHAELRVSASIKENYPNLQNSSTWINTEIKTVLKCYIPIKHRASAQIKIWNTAEL